MLSVYSSCFHGCLCCQSSNPARSGAFLWLMSSCALARHPGPIPLWAFGDYLKQRCDSIEALGLALGGGDVLSRWSFFVPPELGHPSRWRMKAATQATLALITWGLQRAWSWPCVQGKVANSRWALSAVEDWSTVPWGNSGHSHFRISQPRAQGSQGTDMSNVRVTNLRSLVEVAGLY